jgi:hypothetical protein
MKQYNNILQGKWDENSLSLLGVILSIGISVGFGIASLISEPGRIYWGLFVGFVSILLLIFLDHQDGKHL